MSDLDHELRSRGIGSSEIAMLITNSDGEPLSPWGGPHRLARLKKGMESPSPDTPATRRGHYMEGPLLTFYEDETGAVCRPSPTIQSKQHPIVVDSVDAIAFLKDEPRCIEAKAVHFTKRDQWGEPGTDEIPLHYIAQCQWHCGAHELDVCDVPVDLGGEFLIYTVRFDPELFGQLVDMATKFWVDYVKTDKMPPVDGSYETSRWLSRYLKVQRDDYLQADEKQTVFLKAYAAARAAADEGAQIAKTLENQIKEIIGAHPGIEIPGTGQRITFREQKGRATTDWRAIAEHFSPSQELIQEHTRIGAPYRVFRPRALLEAFESAT